MKHFVTLLAAVGISASLFALNELGPLADARRQHPSVFVSNCALEYVVGGKPCYVYGGESRQRFKGDAAIKDSVLFREAERHAKMNLYRFLTKGDKSLTFEMSGALCMYSFKEDNTAKAIYFVPKENVRISQWKAPTSAPSTASATATGEVANARVYDEINNAVKVISQTHVVSADVNMPTNQGALAKSPEPQLVSTPGLNSVNNLTNSPDVNVDMPDPFKNMRDPFKDKTISGTPNNAEKSFSNGQKVPAGENVSTSQATSVKSPEQKPALMPSLNLPGNQSTDAPGESTASTSRVDKLSVYLKQMEENPGNCAIMSEVARLYAEKDDLPNASGVYAKIVKHVVADKKMDKMSAVDLLFEAAEFEKEYGDPKRALDYYRTFVRCDAERGWKLQGSVAEANKNISQLLIKVF
ncbi:MAG: hypothetical protein IJG13_20855 [Kiritimatiellae bacterium]|nr:hypothetical protein [Kiritimatiellia bacterium]